MTDDENGKEESEPEVERRKGSLVAWVQKATDAPQQIMVEGKLKFVKFQEIEKDYEIFSVKGAYAKIPVDAFDLQPAKIEDMGVTLNKDGTAKEIGSEADNYMSAFCFNKITADKDDKVTRDNVWKLKKFLQAIIFGGNNKLRDSPSAGITKELQTTIKFEWESYKYRVSMSKDAYRKIELKAQKILNKKDEIEHQKAFSLFVKTLQKSMKLMPGFYTSAQGFANYFTRMYDAMFPNDFGTDERIAKLKKEGTW